MAVATRPRLHAVEDERDHVAHSVVVDVLNERRIHDDNISEQFSAQIRPDYLDSMRALIQRRREAGP